MKFCKATGYKLQQVYDGARNDITVYGSRNPLIFATTFFKLAKNTLLPFAILRH